MNTRFRSDYASTHAPGTASGSIGALISAVDADSPAEGAGITPGMSVIEVDGQPLRDIIDWLWLTDKEEMRLTVMSPKLGQRDGSSVRHLSVTLTRDWGEDWGLSFADVLFDGLKTCCNNCVFCFMSLLPKGMRPSLYVRDDDYRLSFLQGNFVTLTNMTNEEIERVIEYRLSPLHVSLHAIDPKLRLQLIGRNPARGIEALEQLLSAGIEAHLQIVVIPGHNDGAQLDATLAWIEKRPGILSVGIVPYGYTRHADIQSPFDPKSAQAIIAQVAPFQQRSLATTGMTRFQLADEWYLKAGLSIPAAEYYGDFPQFEDGIGMLRSFIDSWQEYEGGALAQALKACVSPILVTGEAFAPTLRQLTRRLPVEVVAIKNEFFGGNVDVTGLLTAEDIIWQLSEGDLPLPRGATVIIPDVLFNADGLTLDDYRAEDIARLLGCQVLVVPCSV